jgi:hypothetical protein
MAKDKNVNIQITYFTLGKTAFSITTLWIMPLVIMAQRIIVLNIMTLRITTFYTKN